MSTNNKAIVDKANAAFERNDLEAFLALCADGIDFNMVGHKRVTGKDAVRQWMGSMKSDPPKIKVDHVVAEGEMVVAKGTMKMSEKPGAPEEDYTYADVYQIRDEQIVSLTAFVVKTNAQPDAAGV